MSITATMVKALRDKTGAGMMECKKALVETEGDVEKAITLMREKGIASASKKSGRATGEGLVGLKISDDGKKVAMAELNCETDFVAKTEDFVALLDTCTSKAMEIAGIDSKAGGEAVASDLEDLIKAAIAKLGENMGLARAAALSLEGPGGIGTYRHSDGKLAVAVEVKAGKAETADKPEFKELLKNLGMQVAGHIPAAQGVSKDEIDKDFIEKETQIAMAQARELGKPENMLEKISQGKVAKVLQEITLLDQVFIMGGKDKVKDVVAKAAKELGDELTITRFVRIKVGEASE